MTADDIQQIIFKKEIEETPLDKLLDEYEQYIKLRSTDLFEARIALIRQEIRERCEKAAEPAEVKTETVTEDTSPDWASLIDVIDDPPPYYENPQRKDVDKR